MKIESSVITRWIARLIRSEPDEWQNLASGTRAWPDARPNLLEITFISVDGEKPRVQDMKVTGDKLRKDGTAASPWPVRRTYGPEEIPEWILRLLRDFRDADLARPNSSRRLPGLIWPDLWPTLSEAELTSRWSTKTEKIMPSGEVTLWHPRCSRSLSSQMTRQQG